ncbi:hypothetical protein MA16_Dca022657 [Dendrobium catenatum]|uniref:Uncharacterized protein n=1 Tax=Dendrobium catenatum TaxID=906689 RepID=A0A2I0VRT4_9ASPA|nr:hypothetical protein MA16_Dca022657 [Dendrobium catenatum]
MDTKMYVKGCIKMSKARLKVKRIQEDYKRHEYHIIKRVKLSSQLTDQISFDRPSFLIQGSQAPIPHIYILISLT